MTIINHRIITDEAVWHRVKIRAAIEGRTLKEVIQDLLETYAAGGPDPRALQPAKKGIHRS